MYNFVSYFVLSLDVYIVYMWVTNYMSFSKTYASIVPLHQSYLYYLTVLLCVGLCFFVDYFISAIQFNLFPTPSDFLRTVVKMGYRMEDNEDKFYSIFAKIKTHYVTKSIHREQKLEKRREELALMVAKHPQ